jgi:hypothetical protein
MTKMGFSKSEDAIINLFKKGTTIIFNKQIYKIEKVDKPKVASGECKTDVYVLLSNDQNYEEIKISIKQNNADFIENKLRLPRAKEIFGENAATIIYNSIQSLHSTLEKEPLIYFKSFGNTEEGSVKFGWRFDLVKRKTGNKVGTIKLTPAQEVEVYAGTSLTIEKKNAIVLGEVITDSGIANYVLDVESEDTFTECQDVIDNLSSIQEYAENHNIYFACKAINFRVHSGKCESRHFAVYVDWKIESGQLKSELIYDNPLSKTTRDIKNSFISILNELEIDKTCFNTLLSKLDNVEYYPEDYAIETK